MIFRFVFCALALAGLAAGQSMSANLGLMTMAGATASVDLRTLVPVRHTVQWVTTGSPTGCTLRLEGSLDGSTWADLSGSQACTASGMFHVVDRPVLYARVYVVSLSGGSLPVLALRYVGVR